MVTAISNSVTRFTRFTKKGLQSICTTASLLIKRKFIRKNPSLLLFWLKKVDTSWAPVGGNRGIFPAERNHVGIGAVKKNMLLILHIISIT
jgi:hypothetical protein